MKIGRSFLLQRILPGIITIILPLGINAQTSMQLKVKQPLVLTVNAGSDVTINAGFSTVLGGSPTATGGTGSLTYQWSYPEYLNNATVINPVAEPPGNLNFKVTVTDENKCTASDEVFVTVIGGTSIDENEAESSVKIFPNPTSGIFTLSLENLKSPDIQVTIVDISGKIVYKSVIKNSEFSITSDIDISDLSKGYYFLHIDGNLESIYRQIILK